MISIREWLLTVLANDFNKIKIINGYNYDVNAIYTNFVDINTHNLQDFPCIWFEIIENPYNNSKSISRRNRDTSVQITIGGYIGYDNNNSISYYAEKLITDILCCLYQIFPQSTVLNTLKTNIQWDIKSIDPYLDPNSENKAEIRTTLEINYEDSIDLLRTINTDLPTIPVISTPTNGSTITTNQPNITWGSVSSALTYYLQVATDNSFGSLITNQQYINETGYTINSNDALSNGTYYARLKAFNSNGYSDWSSTVNFTINSTTIVEKDWNELSGVTGWWNSYSTNAITISSGAISAALDQIASRNLTQTTSTRRPSLSGNAYGSLSSIYFNPTFASESDVLTYNDTGSAFKWGNSTTGSMILVMMSDGTNFDGNSGYFCPLARSNTNFGNELAFLRGVNSGPQGYCLGYPYPGGDYSVVPIGLNIPQHIIITHSNTASTIYLNGTKIGQVNKAFTTFSSEGNSYLVLGGYYEPAVNYASGRYTGHIFEAGFNTTVLTQAQVKQSYAKFKTRFGL